MTRGTLSRISLTAAVFLLCVNSARSGEIRRLTLHISELQIIVIPRVPWVPRPERPSLPRALRCRRASRRSFPAAR